MCKRMSSKNLNLDWSSSLKANLIWVYNLRLMLTLAPKQVDLCKINVVLIFSFLSGYLKAVSAADLKNKKFANANTYTIIFITVNYSTKSLIFLLMIMNLFFLHYLALAGFWSVVEYHVCAMPRNISILRLVAPGTSVVCVVVINHV